MSGLVAIASKTDVIRCPICYQLNVPGLAKVRVEVGKDEREGINNRLHSISVSAPHRRYHWSVLARVDHCLYTGPIVRLVPNQPFSHLLCRCKETSCLRHLPQTGGRNPVTCSRSRSERSSGRGVCLLLFTVYLMDACRAHSCYSVQSRH